jgi:hypothetical protein
MVSSRRSTLISLAAVAAFGQDASQGDKSSPLPKPGEEDPKLPNGKSQRDEIARQQHADALKDVDALVAAAEELRDELKHAGDFVVPVTSVRKTEEIEKLAKKIRGRLKS